MSLFPKDIKYSTHIHCQHFNGPQNSAFVQYNYKMITPGALLSLLFSACHIGRQIKKERHVSLSVWKKENLEGPTSYNSLIILMYPLIILSDASYDIMIVSSLLIRSINWFSHDLDDFYNKRRRNNLRK